MGRRKNRLRYELQKIKKASYRWSLKWHVANYVWKWHKTDEEIKGFFNDLINNGCACGMIGELLYYSDTCKFFDKYYKDIEELREEWEESVGEPLKIKGDLKNFYAWFGFEETAYQIANELELDV